MPHDPKVVEALRALSARIVDNEAHLEGLRSIVVALAAGKGIPPEQSAQMIDEASKLARDRILAAFEDTNPEFAAWFDKDRPPEG